MRGVVTGELGCEDDEGGQDMERVGEGDRGEVGVGEVGEAGHGGRGGYRGVVTGGLGSEDDGGGVDMEGVGEDSRGGVGVGPWKGGPWLGEFQKGNSGYTGWDGSATARKPVCRVPPTIFPSSGNNYLSHGGC